MPDKLVLFSDGSGELISDVALEAGLRSLPIILAAKKAREVVNLIRRYKKLRGTALATGFPATRLDIAREVFLKPVILELGISFGKAAIGDELIDKLVSIGPWATLVLYTPPNGHDP